MNRKLFFKLFFLVSFLFLGFETYSQVGINTVTPNKLTELDIKNLISDTSSDTIPKGIMIPRMTQKLRDQIDITSDVSLANGLLIYNIDEDCYNYYHKIDKEWKSLCGKYGTAIYSIDCSTVQVLGKYSNDVELTSSNFVKLTITVTKPGSYAIMATPTDQSKDNGYYFSDSGEFLTTGTFTITLKGMGTPKNYSNPDFDHFTIVANSVGSSANDTPCTFDVEVKNSAIRPLYTMDCSSIMVRGQYYEDVALTLDNYIELKLNVESTAIGATWEITTTTVDGISFSGSGILTSTTQVVKLYGTGTPYDTEDKMVYLRSNSESSTATCTASVYIIIPQKRVLGVDNQNLYNYALVYANPSQTTGTGYRGNRMITDTLNFGPNRTSIVKYSGFFNSGDNSLTNAQVDSPDKTKNMFALSSSQLPGNATGEARLKKYLFGDATFPGVDMFIIGYDWGTMTSTMADDILTFMNNGGIVLMFCENTSQNVLFLNKVFGTTDINIASGGGAGSIYRYASVDDPILNGPFGSIMNLTWGEDATTTLYATNLPLTEVVLYTSSTNISGATAGNAVVENSATAFRHRSLPFVWVGDGGFTSSGDNTSNVYCPFMTGTKTINGVAYPNYPIAKTGFGNAGSWPVYNSLFTANAIAWCIKKSEELKRAKRKSLGS